MPFFSIILPTYNCEATILTCLKSIVNQTFTDFELLIVDGSSTDQTVSFIQTFMKTDLLPNYILISEKDKGIYDAMNKGARFAKGRWLYFLGSDDEFINNSILMQAYQHLSIKKKSDFCYGNVLLNSNGKLYDGRFNLRRLMLVNICHQAIFVTRNTFMELGSFDTRYRLWADWDFNLKVFQARKCVSYMNITIAHYNNTGESSVTRDHIFLKRLEEIRQKFYDTFLNKFSSRIRYLAKRIRKVTQGATNTPDVQ